MRHFDLLIIGSGSGNAILDDRFADWDVAIVEKGVGSTGAFGGTCLNVGCIPSKMYVHTADVASSPEEGTKLGVQLTLQGASWPQIRDRIFDRIDPISGGGWYYRAHENENVTLYDGTAHFTGIREIQVRSGTDTETVTADRVVVAAGSRPTAPDIPGLAEVGYHTSDSVLRLDELPERMTVLGTGFIAAELAHVFSALGVTVTVIGRSGALLRSQDTDISRRFTELAEQRWDVRLHRQTRLAERDSDGTTVRLHLDGPGGPETVETDLLLVATGRRPNSDLVHAHAGGLHLTEDGRIQVDATQATHVPGVWALGDVSSPYQLKHVANREAHTVQHNVLHPDAPISTDHSVVPHAVFSHPQIASVGLTEQEATRRAVPFVTATQDYADIAYGWALEDTSGFAKILADPHTRHLLGAHIIGPQAPTLIQPLIQAMQFGLDADTMARGQYWIHPAMPELVENALLNLPR
ncbi:mycothione reductase [Lipingzhangella sp. LS1_29]|uniref:Mycothione reductase n=1 Tax=Lipingzhangella rawalii TaxID=2055835 RepID=A0ABU2H2X3_9ACTN|nr:mycothione reductase [Lipingzhangella rawalii]MDS1269654.1 mycothione reductase [Lipingzhangella rawalii]